MIQHPITRTPGLARLLVAAIIPLLVTGLAGCTADPEQEKNTVSTNPPVNSQLGPGVAKTRSAPLDLSISRSMMHPLLESHEHGTPPERPATDSLVIPDGPENASRIRLKGELYYDDRARDSGGSYLDAIDGGRVDIEIRFNG